MTKLHSERAHAKMRFMERHNLDFNRHIRREFERLILCKQTHLIEKQSNRVSVHDVIYEGKVYRVVWDRIRKTIITTLPDKKSLIKIGDTIT